MRRDEGKTVIAGYPWFLDWGRDSLICARGLLAAGMIDEVKQLLLTFANLKKTARCPTPFTATMFPIATPPTRRCGSPSSARNSRRDQRRSFIRHARGCHGRTIRDVLTSIAENYARGTPNGIRMDPDSALIWSPSHFTWMDTNYPAGTPREGYPVEIQVLWIRLLRQAGKHLPTDRPKEMARSRRPRDRLV